MSLWKWLFIPGESMHLYRFAQFAFVKYPLVYGKKLTAFRCGKLCIHLFITQCTFCWNRANVPNHQLKKHFYNIFTIHVFKKQHCGLCYESLNTSNKVYLPYFEDIVLYNEIWNTLNVQYQQTLDFLMLNLWPNQIKTIPFSFLHQSARWV